jgi:serine/threonine protein kinase
VKELGQYRLRERLGAGAYGTVWLAEGPTSGGAPAVVAVKQLHHTADPEARRALLREFELMRRVRHRSLVKVFDFLEQHDAVVMEVVEGLSLDAVLAQLAQEGRRMPVDAVLDLGMELADCLFQAYSTPGADGKPLRLVHRDLKPENVMLTPRGEVKVLDFGLARARREGQGRERGILGTPLYMAPEQALGQGIDHRSDLFAVGLILFEALMGRGAYQVDEDADDPEQDALSRIERGDLGAEVADLLAQYPFEGGVIARCLDVDRRHRPVDGHQLMVDLQSVRERPRGVALENFCAERVSVHHQELRGATASGLSDPNEPRRVTPMSNEKPPRPGGAPPRPSPGPARPSPGAPRPPGPVARPPGPVRPPAGAPPGPVAGGPVRRGPPGPVIDSEGLPPVESGPRSARDALSSSGARAPDEPGMLEMVKLVEEDDQESSAPKTATAFFKVPQSTRKKPAAAIGGGGAAIAQPAPHGGAAGAIATQSGGAPIAGPMAPAVGISGPVAGAPMAIRGPTAAPDAPFGRASAPPDDADIGRNRTRSYVTIAVVGAMLLSFFGAVALAGAGVVYYVLTREPEPEPEPEPDPVARGPAPIIEEEEFIPLPVAPPPRPAPQAAPRTVSAPKAAPAAPGGSMTVRLQAGDATAVTATCKGYRQRGRFDTGNGVVTFSEVPPDVTCTLTFSNLMQTTNAKFSSARPGQSYTCTVTGPDSVVCK